MVSLKQFYELKTKDKQVAPSFEEIISVGMVEEFMRSTLAVSQPIR